MTIIQRCHMRAGTGRFNQCVFNAGHEGECMCVRMGDVQLQIAQINEVLKAGLDYAPHGSSVTVSGIRKV